MISSEARILLLETENSALREANANLTAQVLTLTDTVNRLLEELTELKSKLAQNSNNRRKPPSTDLKRTKSLGRARY